MKTMLLSFKSDVYKRVITGNKIFEHRRVFPNEPIRAYLYVSTPIKAITGIMELRNRESLEEWKIRYSDNDEVVKRIDIYLEKYKYVMQITSFQPTNAIPLEKLRKDIDNFVVPQMYYFIDNTNLECYLEKELKLEGDILYNDFSRFSNDKICQC